MKPRQYQLLLHPLFLAALCLLLLNDISLKYEFHNALTGKLSDFCGIFCLAIFLLALFPRQRIVSLVLIALFFAWWKSPLSQPIIDLMNGLLPTPMGRVVDYSDLFALAMLPFAYLLAIDRVPVLTHRLELKATLIGLFAVCLFCNSTCYTQRGLYYENTRRVYMDGWDFKTSKSEEEIKDVFSKMGASWHIDSIHYRKLVYNNLYLAVKPDSLNYKPFHIQGDTSLYSLEKSFFNFYIIESLKMPEDELTNVEIRIEELKSKTRVQIISFHSKNYAGIFDITRDKQLRNYKRYFKDLLR